MDSVLVTQTTQANQALQVTCQAEAGLFRAATLKLGFAEELFSVVSCAAVKLLLLGVDELRALVSWGTTTW